MRRVLPVLVPALLALAPAAAQPLDLAPAELAWLADTVVPLATTDPAAPLDDLAFLTDFVGDARVVGLGEATHGNREVARARHRIVRYLVEELGFTHVLFEAPFGHAAELERFVRDGEGDADEALEHLVYWPWRIEAVRDLLVWARGWNDAGGSVRVAGMDVQHPFRSIDAVLAFVARHEPAYLAEAGAHYAFTEELRAGEDVAGRWLRGGRAVHGHLVARRDAYLARVPAGEVAWALQHARVVLQGAESRYDTLPSRDAAMAETVAWWLEHDPDARVVVWAHNSHVAEHEARPRTDPPLGAFLAARYGEAYRSVGVVLHEGAFTAWDREAGGPVETSFAPLSEGYLGQQFARLDRPVFFLSLDGAEASMAPWVGRVQLTRRAGHGITRGSLSPIVPARAFDGLLFFARVTPSRVLLPPSRPAR